jgi:predicted nucleic acid-binding Zn ribbon protein
MTDKRRPSPIADVLAGVLADAGIRDRVAQAAVVPEWARLVGPQIAAVTEPTSVSPDGTLWVAVATHAWMTELQAMEPELLRTLNAAPDRPPVTRIRLVHRRPDGRAESGAEQKG